MVYLIENPIQNICKIGCSNNPEARLAALQTATPNTLLLRAVIEGGFEEEKALHERFKADRLGGEWFSLTDGIMSYFGVQREFFIGPRLIGAMFNLEGGQLKVLLAIALRAEFNTNDVLLTTDTKTSIAEELGLAYGTVNNAITKLVDYKFLKRCRAGVYTLDPSIAWRGIEEAKDYAQQQFDKPKTLAS
jgi:hypothetical protein